MQDEQTMGLVLFTRDRTLHRDLTSGPFDRVALLAGKTEAHRLHVVTVDSHERETFEYDQNVLQYAGSSN